MSLVVFNEGKGQCEFCEYFDNSAEDECALGIPLDDYVPGQCEEFVERERTEEETGG